MKKRILSVMLLATITTTGAIANEPENLDPKIVTIGDLVKATLLNGYINGMDPIPMVFTDDNNCKYIGEAKYMMTPERVSVEINKRSCIIDGQITETDLKGFVTDELKYGISANVDYSNDKITATVNPGKNLEIYISEVYSTNISKLNALSSVQQVKEPLPQKEHIKEKLEKQYVKNGCNTLTKSNNESQHAFVEKLKNCLTVSYMQSIDEVISSMSTRLY